MKNGTVIFYIALSVSVCSTTIAGADGLTSMKTGSQEVFEKTVEQYGSDIMVVKACDDRKKVIVEGYKKGEIMQRGKAAETARLL
ncbi:MAG TPA: hypothetical protein VJL62_01275, partial [Thermodesulfobacteriota bacterium]|nr:hypothetical protein [Thermodesulfobacteriota bacterium]